MSWFLTIDWWWLPLTKGMHTAVSCCDFEELNKHKWHAQRIRKWGHVVARKGWNGVRYESILMHRQLANPQKGMVVDHISRDPLDNRRHNLRVCTQGENACNSNKQKNNKSGFKGVCWKAHCSMWMAYITKGGKQKYLGYYNSKLDAAKVYDAAAVEIHGEFALTNKQLGLL